MLFKYHSLSFSLFLKFRKDGQSLDVISNGVKVRTQDVGSGKLAPNQLCWVFQGNLSLPTPFPTSACLSFSSLAGLSLSACQVGFCYGCQGDSEAWAPPVQWSRMLSLGIKELIAHHSCQEPLAA